MSDLKEWMNPLIPADTRVQIADGEIERLRGITNTPHFKPRSRAELKYLSHDELVSDVIRFEMKYLHRSSMFFHLDQSYEKLRAELAASRHELEGAKKAANAQARLIDSLEQQSAHLYDQRDQWIEARNTLESERAANARLTEELAASREREARMRGALRNLLALDVDHQRGADDEDVCAEVSEARAALAEGAQG